MRFLERVRLVREETSGVIDREQPESMFQLVVEGREADMTVADLTRTRSSSSLEVSSSLKSRVTTDVFPALVGGRVCLLDEVDRPDFLDDDESDLVWFERVDGA